jgi:hypothetical protein
MAIRKFASLMAITLFLVNCASTPEPEPLPQVTEEVRSSLETVGVITVGPNVGGELDAPVGVGNQIAIGVIGGGAIGGVSGDGAGALIGLTCGPLALFCVPAGAVIGGSAGLVVGGTAGGLMKGSEAISESTAVRIETALTHALEDRELQNDLRQRTINRIEIASTGIDFGARETRPENFFDYAFSENRNVDSVLELSLTQVGFAGGGGDDPTLYLVIMAHASLNGMNADDVLWDAEQVTYVSEPAAFSLWTAGNSGLIQAEIDNGLESVARQLSEALFAAPAI